MAESAGGTRIGSIHLLRLAPFIVGEIYIDLGKYKEALNSSLLGLNKMQKINFTRGIAESSSNLGLAYDMMGEADSAIHYYNLSIEAATKEKETTPSFMITDN